MRNTQFVKTFSAGAAVTKRRIVKPGAADGEVVLAAAVSDLLLGIADIFDAASGEDIDIHLQGAVPTECGAAITRGERLTSDASGRAIPVSVATDKIIGVALTTTTAAGQLVDVLIDRSA